MEHFASLGQKLQALRRRKGASQDEVADAVGISRSYLAGLENDHDKPGFDSFVALADYYGVSLDWLAQRHHDDPGDPAQQLGLLRQMFRFLYEGPAPEQRRKLARQLLVEMDIEGEETAAPDPEMDRPRRKRGQR